MGAHALNRVVASSHLGDDGVVIVGVEPSAVADLAAGFGVEGRVVEDDLALLTGLEFLRALAVLDEWRALRNCRSESVPIAFKVGFWELLVGGILRFALAVPFQEAAGRVRFVRLLNAHSNPSESK